MTTKKKPVSQKKPVSLEAMMADEPAAVGEGATVIAHPAAAPPTKPVKTKHLKLMGIEHDKRVNDLLQEVVEMMLAKYGQPSLKEFENL
jgi:hypothetical protein